MVTNFLASMASLSWFMYLLWAPLLTLFVIIRSLRGGRGGLGAIPAYLVITVVLTAIAGPVMTSVFLMPWWAALILDHDHVHSAELVVVYALVCFSVLSVGGLLVYRRDDR